MRDRVNFRKEHGRKGGKFWPLCESLTRRQNSKHKKLAERSGRAEPG